MIHPPESVRGVQHGPLHQAQPEGQPVAEGGRVQQHHQGHRLGVEEAVGGVGGQLGGGEGDRTPGPAGDVQADSLVHRGQAALLSTSWIEHCTFGNALTFDDI